MSLHVFVRELANPIRLIYPGFERHMMFESNRELKRAIATMSALMDNLIEKRSAEITAKKEEDFDLVDHFLVAFRSDDPEKKLTKQELVSNLVVVIIAGNP